MKPQSDWGRLQMMGRQGGKCWPAIIALSHMQNQGDREGCIPEFVWHEYQGLALLNSVIRTCECLHTPMRALLCSKPTATAITVLPPFVEDAWHFISCSPS